MENRGKKAFIKKLRNWNFTLKKCSIEKKITFVFGTHNSEILSELLEKLFKIISFKKIAQYIFL